MGEANVSVNFSMLVLYSQLLVQKVCYSIRFEPKHIQRVRLRLKDEREGDFLSISDFGKAPKTFFLRPRY